MLIYVKVVTKFQANAIGIYHGVLLLGHPTHSGDIASGMAHLSSQLALLEHYVLIDHMQINSRLTIIVRDTSSNTHKHH